LFKDYYLKSIDTLLLRGDLTSEQIMQLEEKKNYGEEMFKQHTYRHGLVFVFNLRKDLSEDERAYLFRWANATQNTAYRQQTAAMKIIIQEQRDSLLQDLTYKKEGALTVKYPKEKGIKKWIEDNNINIFLPKGQHTFIAPEVSSFIREKVFIIQKEDDTLAYVWEEGGKLYEIEPKDLDRVTSSPLEFKLLLEQLEGDKTTIEVKETEATGVVKKAKSTKKTPAKKTPVKKKLTRAELKKEEKERISNLTGRHDVLYRFRIKVQNIIKKISKRKEKGNAKEHKAVVDGIVKALESESNPTLLAMDLRSLLTKLDSLKGGISKTSRDNLEKALEKVAKDLKLKYHQIKMSRDVINGAYTKESFELDRPKFEALIKVLGIKNVELIFDPKSPLVGLININSKEGQQMLRDQGWEENRIEEARKRGAEIYRCGVYQCIFEGKKEGRIVITLGHGADISTVLHEIAHAFIQQGGEVKGITDRLARGEVANEEWMARELAIKWGEEIKNKGALSGIKKLGKATGKVNINYYRSRPMFFVDKKGVTKSELLTSEQIQRMYAAISIADERLTNMGEANMFTLALNGSPKTHQELAEGLRGLYRGVNNEPITEAEYLKNASWAGKIRKYPIVKNVIEFLLPFQSYREGDMLEVVRLVKSGGLARAAEYVNSLTKKLKKVAADKVGIFFDYVDGRFNNEEIRHNIRVLEKRMDRLDKDFAEKKKYEVKIREMEYRMMNLDESSNKFLTDQKVIEKTIEDIRGRIEGLGLERVELLPGAGKHPAIVLENNPTHKQVTAKWEKVMGLFEKEYWVDDKRALKQAVDAGLPSSLMKDAQEVKKLQLQMGKMLLKHNHITRETYWKWYGSYVHYMYLRNMVGWRGSKHLKSDIVKHAEKRLEASGTSAGMLLLRENLTQIEKQQIAQLKDIRSVIPIGVGETLSVLANDKYYNHLKDPRMGVIIPFNKIKGIIKTEKGYVAEYDIPENRISYKYIDKAEKDGKAWLVKVTEGQRIYHFHIDNLADEISKMEAVIKKIKNDKTIGGYTASDKQQQQAYLDVLRSLLAPVKEHLAINKENLRDHYVRMGENYGDIAGEYLNKAVRDDMVPLVSDEAHKGQIYEEIMKWNAQVTMMFKAGKVALNPPTMFRNMISNLLQNNMRGRPLPHCLLDFMKALTSTASKDQWWQEARDIGLFRGNMMRTEAQEALDHFQKAQAHTTWFKFMSWVSKSTHLYGKIDEVAKLSIYRQLREKGRLNRVGLALSGEKVNPYEAAIIASRYGMDYSLASRSIKHLRKQISPFVTYQYKILPIIAETLAHRPWILMKWVGFLGTGTSWGFQGIAQTLSQSLIGMDDKEWERMLSQLPDFIAENNTYIPLPWKSGDGKVMWFDGLYFMPFGTWYSIFKDLSRGDVAEGFKSMGISNPFLTAYQSLNSATRDKPAMDPFTKQPIYNPLDTPQEKYLKIISWLHNVVTPGVIENFMIPGAQKRGALPIIIDVTINKAKNKELRDKWGRLMGWEQILRFFGINPYAVWPPQKRAIDKARLADLQWWFNKKIRPLHPVNDWKKIRKIREIYNKKKSKILITKSDVGLGGGVYNR